MDRKGIYKEPDRQGKHRPLHKICIISINERIVEPETLEIALFCCDKNTSSMGLDEIGGWTMDIQSLCREIGLPDKMQERVMKCVPAAMDMESEIIRLLDIATAEDAYRKLSASFSDEDGAGLLTCNLIGACRIYGRYQKMGIPDTVFFNTMKCFTRFLEETEKRTGKLVFDRGWWTYRQLSMQLFRIGELEYEMVKHNEKPAISIHIPSDAHFSRALVGESLYEAEAFFSRYLPAYADCEYICDSWLLSPELSKLLHPHSNILDFQSRFALVRFDPEPNDYLVWVFGVPSNWTDFSSLKEETSMQKSIKQHVLKGGKIGIGFGVIKK